jgi:NADH dehydrogenase
MRRPRVLIVGAGFGGIEAARALGNREVDVLVVDRTNHHTFQPLLYQVATATLAPTEITAPIRWMLRHQRNTEVLMAEVREVHLDRKVVTVDGGEEFAFDFLILAAGARHSYFGHPEWEEIAPGLKSIEDAIEMRRRFLLAFERAERAHDAAEQEANLTFVIVGAGPTGVELAGMLPTIARDTLKGEYRRCDPSRSRVILLEGGPRVLPTFPEELSERAAADLRELGVDVRTSSIVTRVERGTVWVGDEAIRSNTVFWAAGNAASSLGKALGIDTDRAGRVPVSADLSVPGHPNVFVVGDLAAIANGGRPVPGVAPAAMQMGRCAARNVLHTVRHEGREDFRYRNKGDLATIGRHRAVADFGRMRVSGWIAWWLWLFVHIMYLAGFRNRLNVLFEWGYAYFTYQRGSRLITRANVEAAEGSRVLTPKW